MTALNQPTQSGSVDLRLLALPLSEAEQEADRAAVLAILRSVASQLEQSAASAGNIRRRLGAVIEGLIAAADAIDGDADLEETCEDEGSQCEDEGVPDDNGMADGDGAAEQGFIGCGAFAGRSIA